MSARTSSRPHSPSLACLAGAPGPGSVLPPVLGSVFVSVFVTVLMSAFLLACGPAKAAVACTASSTGLNVGFFDAGRTTPTRATGVVSVNCTRSDLVNDPGTIYVALGVNSGLYPSGDMSRARLSGGTNQDTIDYWLWRDASETSVWTDKQGTSGTRLVATLNFSGGATASQSVTFHATVPPVSAQTRPVLKGLHLDTQTLSLYQSPVSTAEAAKSSKAASTSTFAVQVTVPENCLLSSPPGNLAFQYTSFQAAPATASTSFAVTCASNVAYTLSLDASSGTLLGLPYTLALSTQSQTGTGVPQLATLTGSIPAGQSGVCSGSSCAASAVRTLTITY